MFAWKIIKPVSAIFAEDRDFNSDIIFPHHQISTNVSGQKPCDFKIQHLN